MMRQLFVLGLATTCIPLAAAQPAPEQQPASGKGDAKALMQSGVKLLEAKDYLGALAVFKDAYARFSSAKILLNIGTTQLLLDRKAEAANSYQKYLDSADADPAKKPDVVQKLAEIDKAVGVLTVSITPMDSEIQINGEDWSPIRASKTWRVAPGPYGIRARKPGFESGDRSGVAVAGASASISVVLRAIAKPETATPPLGQPPIDPGHSLAPPAAPPPVASLTAHSADPPRSKFGGLVLSHVSVAPRLGSAVLLGGTADMMQKLSVDAALILGPGIVSSGGDTMLPPAKFGMFVGAHYAFQTNKTRPRATLGLPVFFDDGPRLAIRIGGGLEYVANNHISVVVDLGGEIEANPRNDIRRFALVPALGVTGRL